MARSALQLHYKQHTATLVIQTDVLELRGLGTRLLQGNRLATSSVIPSVAKQDISTLLDKILGML